MGYSCPVCEDPQADAGHLANHLAFTAMVRGGDHEAWLDEHVPEWGQLGEEELAEIVREFADDTDYPQVFEDTTGQPYAQGHDHDDHAHDQHSSGSEHGHETHSHGSHAGNAGTGDSLPPGADMMTGGLDDDTESVIQEAIEMTRKRQTDEDSPDEHETGDNSGAGGDGESVDNGQDE